MTEGQKSLVRKLCKVMAEVSRVPKNGRNDFHHYDYVTEADLVEAVRDKLAAENVFLFSSVEDLTVTEKTSDRGKTSAITTVRMTFTFVDGDTGEERSFTYYGQGEDAADKGAYKAFTGAVKYALMKSFLVPTGDDPEDDQNDKRRAAQNAAQRQAQQPSRQPETQAAAQVPSAQTTQPEPVSILQAKLLNTAKEMGLTMDQLRSLWKSVAGKDTMKGATVDQLQAALDMLQARSSQKPEAPPATGSPA